MEKQGVIYKIENLVNGKVYIGQTVRKLERRISEHKRKLMKNTHDNCLLQNSWNKHKEESFVFSLVQKCHISELDKLEVELIAFYKSKNLSYNLESGGNKQKTLSDITKKKLSDRRKSNGWIKGNIKGKHHMARKVICINNNMIFDSVISASEYFKMDYKTIYQNVLGKNTASLGLDGNWYQFDYYEEGKEYKLKNIRNIKSPRKVVLINTGEIYNSTREASEKTGVQQGHISMCCNNKRQHAGKLKNGEYIVWRFEDEYNQNENFSFEKRKESTYKAKGVICLTTNEIFPSITEALKRYGMKLTDSSISSACKGKKKHAGKLQDGTPLKWKYCD